MAEMKSLLKKVVTAFKARPVSKPPGLERMRKVQEAASKTGKELKAQKG